MALRDAFTTELKTAMLARQTERVSILRMIAAKLKDADIAARPGGPVDDAAIAGMLRGMAKTRRESVALYRQGNRPDLADKEEDEIAVIESYLPAQMGGDALAAAVKSAIAETGAASVKDMGRVMAALRAQHAANLDMATVGPVVKAALGG